MDNLQERELAMYRKVVTFFNGTGNAAIFNALAGWTTWYPTFASGVGPIQVKADAQEVSVGGSAVDKKAKRKLMQDDGITLHNMLDVLAMNTSNATLAAEMNFTTSDITQASESQAIVLCQLVRDRANSNSVVLNAVPYSAPAGLISGLQAKIDAYTAVLANPQISHEAQEALTAALLLLFVAERVLLKKLDKVAKLLLPGNSGMYLLWQAARKIDAVAHQHASMFGQVRGSDTNAGLAGAEVKLAERDVTLKAGQKGNYRSGHLEDGYLTVEVSADGYHTVTVHVTVVHDVPKRMDFTLVHL